MAKENRGAGFDGVTKPSLDTDQAKTQSQTTKGSHGPEASELPSLDTPGLSRGTLGTIGRYKLIREIGRGGYGIVFLASDTELHREVAVKIARPEITDSEEGVERFLREAQIAGTLRHPGIIPVFDCGVEGKLHYYVMPYIDSQHLGKWMDARKDDPVDEKQAAEWVRDIAAAIHYGHEQGVVHRDIKPQNILLNASSESPSGFSPVVLDFGLCGVEQSASVSTSVLAGTPNFMSPEQAMFGRKRITKQSDIYSIGAVLYRMLTGETPHPATTLPEAILMLHNEPVRSPRTIRPELSKRLETICMKCLRKEPERRYESAKALADDLGRFLSGETLSAKPESRWERLQFSLRYRDWEARLGWSAIGISVGSFIWAFVGALLIVARDGSNPVVIEHMPALLMFETLIVLPVHGYVVYQGWLMVKRTTKFVQLAISAALCGAWAIFHWVSLFQGSTSLKIYEGQEYAHVMVFLLISAAFTVISVIFAVGYWLARGRHRSERDLISSTG
ncbi:serine/threonine protein kinase [Rhodopirellula sallentina]|uniref:serine/threonine protein kinase n=1 Tax=Rhodopirellula sallentina TaxID=1263869 RepID=UPI001360B40B|nr:serine/threonine-protein kinase [Rhodopirellula sallentina]